MPSAATMRSADAVSPFSNSMRPASASSDTALWFTFNVQGGPSPGEWKADLSNCWWMSIRWKLLYSWWVGFPRQSQTIQW